MKFRKYLGMFAALAFTASSDGQTLIKPDTNTMQAEATFSLAGTSGYALPLPLDPPSPGLEAMDRDGTLLIFDDLRQADFGGGLKLPVRWAFRGSNHAASHYGWAGFSLTMLEASAVKTTSLLYTVTMLNGEVQYFSKDPNNTTGTWFNNSNDWEGTEGSGNTFTIKRWDGWQLVFKNGLISSLQTPDDRHLQWQYNGDDPALVTEIREVSTGHIVVAVGLSSSNDMSGSSSGYGAHTITINGDTYSFKYADGTLSEVDYPDGRKKQWSFQSVSSAQKRLTLTKENGWWKSWVFDATNGYMVSDDYWNYKVTGGTPILRGDNSKKIEDVPKANDGSQGDTALKDVPKENDGTQGDTIPKTLQPVTPQVVYDRPTIQRTRITTAETEKWSYGANNSIWTNNDVLGNQITTYSYQGSTILYGKPYKIERQRPGDESAIVTWRGVYDAHTGDLTSSFDDQNNETTYAYARNVPSGLVPPAHTTVTDPLGRSYSIQTDTNGNVTQVVNAAGVIRNFTYDNQRRLLSVRNASGQSLESFVYGQLDQVTSRTDALGNTTTYAYTNHLGVPLLTQVTTPEGLVTTFNRDSMGRITSIVKPSGSSWNYSYVGGWGVVESKTDPLGNQTDYEYDQRLNQIRVTDPLGNITQRFYDDLDLPQSVTDANGSTTTMAHNANRDLKSLTDARANTYSFSWDQKGLRSSLEWPDASSQSNLYDISGRLTQWSAKGGGGTLNFSRNDASEVIGRTWQTPSDSGTNTYTRNANGQITSTVAASAGLSVNQSYGYNSEGQLASLAQTIGGVTRSAGVTYDLNGRVVSITYPAGFVVGYQYNNDGQIASISKSGSVIASYDYDDGGRLTNRTLGNGIVTATSYDVVDRVASIAVTGTNSLWTERYNYDAAGRRVATVKPNSTNANMGDSYWLDGTGQLRNILYGSTNAFTRDANQAGVINFQYDGVGNRTLVEGSSGTNSYSANNLNQYSSISSMGALGYSWRGDLTQMGSWSFAYDAQGNLLRAHNSGTNVNVNASYFRDVEGHRAVKRVNGTQTLFFNLGSLQLEKYDVSAGIASSTIYEPGTDRPLAEVAANGAVTYYHQDVLGNVVLLTSATGAVVESYSYDAWGKVKVKDGTGAVVTSTPISRFLYTAREYDAESGLYDYRARAYSPELGRFLQMDPIDFAGGDVNIFRYVGNDPLDWTDPSGKNYTLLNDSRVNSGHGHSASLVGNDKSGYYYYAKNGGNDNDAKYYKSREDFQNDTTTSGRYDRQIDFATTPEDDKAMRDYANKEFNTPYDLTFNDCADLSDGIMAAGGIDNPGNDRWKGIITDPDMQYNNLNNPPVPPGNEGESK